MHLHVKLEVCKDSRSARETVCRSEDRATQARSQNTADARAQHGYTTFASSLVLRPRRFPHSMEMQKQVGVCGMLPPENNGIFELPRSILKLLYALQSP